MKFKHILIKFNLNYFYIRIIYQKISYFYFVWKPTIRHLIFVTFICEQCAKCLSGRFGNRMPQIAFGHNKSYFYEYLKPNRSANWHHSDTSVWHKKKHYAPTSAQHDAARHVRHWPPRPDNSRRLSGLTMNGRFRGGHGGRMAATYEFEWFVCEKLRPEFMKLRRRFVWNRPDRHPPDWIWRGYVAFRSESAFIEPILRLYQWSDDDKTS